VTTTSDSTRPQRQPTGQPWLDRKYSQQPADLRLAAWADAAIDMLYGVWEKPLSIGPYKTQEAAARAKNALYDSVYKRWNREHHDEQLSLSANVTDPADGKCYARGQVRCEQNGCEPSPGPGWYVHARLYDKRAGRAHQASKPRDTWDYDPLAKKPRRRGQQPPAPAVQGSQPRHRFGHGQDQTTTPHEPPDEPPVTARGLGGGHKSQPRQTAKSGKEAKDGKGTAEPPEREGITAKLRRWAR
jgi:hypothetical protein